MNLTLENFKRLQEQPIDRKNMQVQLAVAPTERGLAHAYDR
jgi:hypothetical protein